MSGSNIFWQKPLFSIARRHRSWHHHRYITATFPDEQPGCGTPSSQYPRGHFEFEYAL